MDERFSSEDIEEPGVFTWSLDTDELYGDTAVAALFGLDMEETIRGLPISTYLARVHPDDRRRVAAVISDAVKSGLPYNAEYRVIDANNDARWVVAMGRCFRDRSGNPSHYAGLVYPTDGLIVDAE